MNPSGATGVGFLSGFFNSITSKARASILRASLVIPRSAANATDSERAWGQAVIPLVPDDWKPSATKLPNVIGDAAGGGRQDAPARGPELVVEHCTFWLPADIARLPELDLGETLARRLHCYAHGGFMGVAISMLADPEWESILLEAVAGTSPVDVRAKVRAASASFFRLLS